MEKESFADRNYYLGLDIGTSSVGFAVTDENYNLIRKSGKHLWGSRLFDEAKDASGRRSHRAARRRYQRRRERILLLRDIFEPEISKIDPLFFKKLDYAAYHVEDKPEELKTEPYIFDCSEKIQKFKTIYHLRKKLLKSKKKEDIRLIYLAFSHMIKYRGNFLTQGDIKAGGKDCFSFVKDFEKVNDAICEIDEFQDDGTGDFPSFDIDEAKATELLDHFKKNEKKSDLLETEKSIFKAENKVLVTILKLINGSDLKNEGVFPELIKENPELKAADFSFEQEDYEDAIAALGLPEEYRNFLFAVKGIYDTRVLFGLLRGRPSISEAMVEIYKEHQKQLLALKKIYKEVAPERYSKFFEEVPEDESPKSNGKPKKKVNYVSYVGLFKRDGRVYRIPRQSSEYKKLYAQISKDLDIDNKIKDESISESVRNELAKIKDAMEREIYLRIQNGKTNGVFPYQLNKNEMRSIIEKQSKYYPFLAEKATSFLDPKKKQYKLISLLEYKIPYFVGPLKPAGIGEECNRWVVRKEDGKITPWNFYQKVDASATAKAFIDRMKNACSYLRGEETLPRQSLVYLQYLILNELNNIYLNDSPLTTKEKDYLFENLYKVKKKVGVSAVKDALAEMHNTKQINLRTRNGSDEEKLADVLKTSYSSYVDFANPKGFGTDFDKNAALFDKAEKIILLITLFEEKSVLINELQKLDLTEDQIKYFASLTYTGWGRFSRKLLTNKSDSNKSSIDILSNPVACEPDISSKERRTILALLRYTPDNFESIYNNPEYGFSNAVDVFNKSIEGKNLSLETLIEESYASPAMKRALRQTMAVVAELKKILKIPDFKRIFVECTREKEKDPKKKSSRKKKLEELYQVALKTVKEEKAVSPSSLDEINTLKSKLAKKEDSELRAKKLFYYFAQFGRDVYSGKKIELDQLSSDYDIDHIIPQAIFKDDSFLNTVLVAKTTNNTKSDTYPFAQDSSILKPEGEKWIRFLNKIHGNDYMSKEKLNRILRKNDFAPNELEGFVNRQIVTTNQTVKAVCDILKAESNSEIIYSRAANVSEFRNIFGLIKLRSLNDFHHANDAYLNIVVGNVYYEKFCNLYTKNWIEKQRESNPDFRCYTDVLSVFTGQDFVYSRKHDGTIVWHRTLTEEERKKKYHDRDPMKMGGTIDLIRKTMSWNDPMVTHMLHIQKGDQGLFQKATIVKTTQNSSALEGLKKKITKASFPLKSAIDDCGVANPFSSAGWADKYGGYSDLTNSYFYLVKSKQKKEEAYSVEAIPSYIALKKPEPTKEELKEFFEKNGLIDPVPMFKLLINSIFEIPVFTKDGRKEFVRLGLSGKSGNSLIMINLNELHLDLESQRYYRSIAKILGLNLPSGTKKDLKVYQEEQEQIVEGKHCISKKENIAFYKMLCSTAYSEPKFANIPGSQASRFKDNLALEHFSALSVINEALILSSMIELLSCHSAAGTDLSSLGPLSDGMECPSKVGAIRINKKLLPGTLLVEESKTGFYRRAFFTIK